MQAAGGHAVAEEVLIRIARLYAVEAKAHSPEDRKRLREEEAQPELKSLHDWLTTLRPTVATGSGLARAIDYVLRHWASFARYAETGDLPIDNNPVENAIRPIALGKKNWLFARSERAGKRAAAIQSLLGTGRLNGFEPLAWLTNTLENLPTCPHSRIDELLPLKSLPD